MKKIIVLFIDVFKTGGIQAYNRHLCDAFESEFGDTEFIAISLYDSRRDNLGSWRNIKIKFCDLTEIKFIRKLLFVFKTALIIITEKPHFLICSHVDLSPLALLLKKIFRLEYAVLTHGIDVWQLKGGIKYQGLRNAHIITSVSKYTKNRISLNDICEDKIKLLQDTIDSSLFYKKSPDYSLSQRLKLENKRILLTVGRINSTEKYKGYDVMLEVLNKIGEGYVWLVIGEGDDLPNLKKMANNLGIAEKIRFLGYISNDKLLDYYNMCDIFILPSKGEGFGIVFLEAMACGKPVIGGNKDGSTEPLMDGKLGFLVNPDNSDEIIQAVNSVFKTKENRTSPAYLREGVEANFGVKTFNKKVKEIFAESIK